ncbi:MAG: 23S rRNA (uracil1939-C5)-methyltransferase [Planctomycetota bacterium]|jgi:23S rRNA (uracil1939-C5)-methyltransferase
METPTPTRKPRRGDVLEGTILRYERKGVSLGDSGEYTFTIRDGVPGDRWSFTVHKRRRAKIEGRRLKLLEGSPQRVPARCSHADDCGGCSFQTCDYQLQLDQKRVLVQEAFVAAELEELPEVEPVLGCENPWAYRNKMEFSFGNRRWVAPHEPMGVVADFALGLHAPGLYLKVIDLTECSIVFDRGEAIFKTARALAREQDLSLWDIRDHHGFLRHLVLREGTNTGQIMVSVVTSEEAPEIFQPYADALLAAHPEITTIVQAINSGAAAVALGEYERVVHGEGWIEEELLGLHFRISAGSFFQTNTLQAEHLFEIVREEAALTGDEVVYDLYSGAGTIALMIASRVREVLAFEQVPAAVADAHRNAERNSIRNVRFFEGDVLTELDATLAPETQLPRPDVAIVDPPRAGLHPKVPGKLLELAAQRIVYISCNIYNGAQDIAKLVAGGYRIERIRPVDMFPHTPHVECVVTLERDDSQTSVTID